MLWSPCSIYEAPKKLYLRTHALDDTGYTIVFTLKILKSLELKYFYEFNCIIKQIIAEISHPFLYALKNS